jgi:hypothetical protein
MYLTPFTAIVVSYLVAYLAPGLLACAFQLKSSVSLLLSL